MADINAVTSSGILLRHDSNSVAMLPRLALEGGAGAMIGVATGTSVNIG